MPQSEDERAEPADRRALSHLESVVGGLLDEMGRLRVRTRRAEARVRDVESLLRQFTTGKDDPVRLQERLTELEEENRELKERVRKGREGVERLLARVRFLEEKQ